MYVVVKKPSDRRENSCGTVAKNPFFCFENCSDLPCEKKCSCYREIILRSQFIQAVKGQNNF